jgi:hypothetical protein
MKLEWTLKHVSNKKADGNFVMDILITVEGKFLHEAFLKKDEVSDSNSSNLQNVGQN